MSGQISTPETLHSSQGRRRKIQFLAAFAALTIAGISLYASQRSAQPAQEAKQKGDDKALARATKAVAAAKTFLDSLDAKERAKATLDFGSAKKSGWSNLPVSIVPRNGVRMGDLSKAQKDAALGLLAATLSKQGYQKLIDIVDADETLVTGKGGKGGKGKVVLGKDEFYLAIFGTPSVTDPWMVQFGGHHLGINITVAAKTFVLTPSHTGTQPESFTRGGKAIRPLGGENDRAFALMATLDDKQKAQAIVSAKPGNLVLGPGKDGKTIKTEGIKGSALTEKQQALLLDVVGEWVNIVNDDDAAARLAEIKSKIADTYFAWSGPTAKGSAAYFRVHGPTLLIEYAPQGSTDHIHTVIRDPTNDYGQKLIKR